MGIEQDTIVSSGSKIDSLPLIDLPDLRLTRAFKAWTEFKIDHQPQITAIGSLAVEEIITLGDELARSMGAAIGFDGTSDQAGRIDQKKIKTLTDAVAGEGNKVVFMRHGEQSPPEWVHSISQPALRKIRMMQDPFNKDDLLTNKALVDVFLTAFGLLYVKEATGKNVHILSSENLRAKEVAEVIAVVIPDSTFATQEGLNSVVYKDERDEPPISIEDILNDLPSGFMPWEPTLVDKFCKETRDGGKQSEAIMRTVGDLVLQRTMEGDDLYVILTHSQQLAEVLRQTGKSYDPSVRYPELSMIMLTGQDQRRILPVGILTERGKSVRNRDMRKTLERLGDGYEWYKIRREEYQTAQKIPFLVSPEPFFLSKEETRELSRIGQDVTAFMSAANELYRGEADIHNLLNRGKPTILREVQDISYLFVRPDLLITDKGFSICEIETSPFGLALAELLNRSYRTVGFETMVREGILQEFIAQNTPSHGSIVYSEKTSSYEGQLRYLAEKVFSGTGRQWVAEQVDFALGKDYQNAYRGFYPYEYLTDMFVYGLVNSAYEGRLGFVPSFTPHMEEKALLSLLWDGRWESFLRGQLGRTSLEHLREVVPPTWVVGQEQYFVPGLPYGISSSEELAGVSKAKRGFVLKKSGFSNGSSWAEGVNFLQEKSTDKARTLLIAAAQDEQSLYVIQEFKPSKEFPMSYNKENHVIEQMRARIRLTPYFSMVPGDEGKLIAIKATGCEDTNYIHASTGSINTAVAVA